MNNEQFDLKFEVSGNKLQSSLKNGEFTVLFEINPPGKDCDLPTVVSRYEPLVQALKEAKDFKAGFAITDRKQSTDSVNIIDFASLLCKENRDSHILFISGRDQKLSKMKETVNACITHGFTNLVPVSGSIYPSDNLKSVQSQNFTESVHALSEFREFKAKNGFINFGCTVNPFKYSEEVAYPQYYKLVNKLKSGADFVIAQAGWDMMKYQELRWYMESRGFFEPSLARIAFLNSENIEKFLSDRHRDTLISNDFFNVLRKEAKSSMVQFMAVQWRRLQFIIAGLRWLGYSGAIISGIDTPALMKTAIAKIIASLKEFRGFNEWKETYGNYLSRADLTPYPYRFYVFNNLFKQAYSDSAKTAMTRHLSCGKAEIFNYNFKKLVFDTGIENSMLARRLFAGCRANGNHLCNLQANHYICRLKCPKKMLNGACQEIASDGKCQFTRKDCPYTRMFRMSSWKTDFSGMEEPVSCMQQ